MEKMDCSERVVRKILYSEELGSLEEHTGTVTPFVVLMNTNVLEEREVQKMRDISLEFPSQ